MSLFRKARITILLYVLLLVAGGAWLSGARSVAWDKPLRVTVYPVAGDAQYATREHITALDVERFAPIERFFAEQAAAHGVALGRPVQVMLGPEVAELPPSPPQSSNPLAVMWWSLKLRWYSHFAPDGDNTGPQVRLFVVFHDPETSPRVAHSLGLRKGLVGVVHAFATRRMRGSNAVVIAHELMHTLGASDRYDPVTLLPQFPQGYAEPARDPTHPQRYAELMGGRIPVSSTRADMPRSLDKVRVGEATALEIRWRR